MAPVCGSGYRRGPHPAGPPPPRRWTPPRDRCARTPPAELAFQVRAGEGARRPADRRRHCQPDAALAAPVGKLLQCRGAGVVDVGDAGEVEHHRPSRRTCGAVAQLHTGTGRRARLTTAPRPDASGGTPSVPGLPVASASFGAGTPATALQPSRRRRTSARCRTRAGRPDAARRRPARVARPAPRPATATSDPARAPGPSPSPGAAPSACTRSAMV